MKLKSKLIMSGVALAACAATLTSTTYAWYTTNTQVDATGITGSTASTGDANVLISTDNSNWSQTADLAPLMRQYYTNNTYQTESDTKTDYYKGANSSMVPVQATVASGAISYKYLDTDAQFSDNSVLTFTLYVKTTATGGENTIPLYVKSIGLTNTFNSVTAADNLLKGKGSLVANGGVNPNNSTYSSDITKALWMSYTSTTVATDKTKIFDLQNCDSSPLADSNLTNPNALTYLNAVQSTKYQKGKTKDLESDVALATEVALGAAAGTGYIKVAELDPDGEATTLTFTVFLNGWDEYCFDVCKGQTFDLTLAFTTDTTVIDTTAKYIVAPSS